MFNKQPSATCLQVVLLAKHARLTKPKALEQKRGKEGRKDSESPYFLVILRIFDVGRFGGSYVFANSGSFLKTMGVGHDVCWVNPEGYDGTPQCYALCIKHSGGATFRVETWNTRNRWVMGGFRGGFNYIWYCFTMFSYLSPLFKGNIVSRCHLFFQRDFSPPSHASFLGKVTRKHTTCEIWFQLVLSAKNPVQTWMNIQKCNIRKRQGSYYCALSSAICFSVLGSVGLHICICLATLELFFLGVILHTLDLPPAQDAILVVNWHPRRSIQCIQKDMFPFKHPRKDFHVQPIYGRFLKWWYPQNTPKWSFLVGKPVVVGYHHFRKPPYTRARWQPCFTFRGSHPWPGHSDECLAQSTTTRAVRTQQVWRPSFKSRWIKSYFP